MSREALAKRQLEFVDALFSKTSRFDGVPSERMVALQDSLANRRFREASRLAPALEAWLGPEFEVKFRVWMGCGPMTGGGLEELLGFAAGLSGCPDAVATELLNLRMSQRGTRRRVIDSAFLPDSQRWVLALGPRRLKFPLGLLLRLAQSLAQGRFSWRRTAARLRRPR